MTAVEMIGEIDKRDHAAAVRLVQAFELAGAVVACEPGAFDRFRDAYRDLTADERATFKAIARAMQDELAAKHAAAAEGSKP